MLSTLQVASILLPTSQGGKGTTLEGGASLLGTYVDFFIHLGPRPRDSNPLRLPQAFLVHG